MKMIRTIKPRTSAALRPALAGLAILFSIGAAHGAVTVTGIATPAGPGFTYSFTVSNTNAFDLAFVNIQVNPGVAISNLTAPAGFQAINDSVSQGFITFLEDADGGTPQTFAPGSTSAAFTFDSTFGPGSVAFDGLDANGDPFSGTTLSAIPEPSSSLLIATAAIPLLISRRRRHNG